MSRRPINEEVIKTIKKMLNLGYKWNQISEELWVSNSFVSRIKNEMQYEMGCTKEEPTEIDDFFERELTAEDFELEEDEINEVETKLEKESKEPKKWIVTETEKKLLKQLQRLRDQKNLNGRQLRAMMRKDNYYEDLVDWLSENMKTIKDPWCEYKCNLNEKVDIVLLSDIHSDELITKKATVYNEEINFKIIQQRIRLYEKTLIERQMKNKNKHLTVLLLWDIISWKIHDELYENKEAGSFDLMYKISVVIAKFISNLSKYWETVYVHTCSWNHWRLTPAIKYSRTDENFDNSVYILVRSILSENKRVKMNIRTEPSYYIKINDKYFWLAHWDEKTAEILEDLWCYVYFVGHFHQACVKQSKHWIMVINWAFNKWNWWVVKSLWKITKHSYQVSMELEIGEDWKITLAWTYYNCVTDWYENLETYWEDLSEENIFGWNWFYEGNVFEQIIWNYR